MAGVNSVNKVKDHTKFEVAAEKSVMKSWHLTLLCLKIH